MVLIRKKFSRGTERRSRWTPAAVAGAAMLAAGLALTPATAQDSGGYRGPQNDGVYAASNLLTSWPDGGPPLLWKCWIDQGYANGTVRADGTVFVAAQIIGGGSSNYVHVISPEGKVLKRIPAGDSRWKRYGGTRSTAIVRGDVFVTTTPDAGIYAIDLGTDAIRWELNAWKSFGSGKGGMGWGYPESPAIHGNTMIFNTCSRFDDTPPLVAVDISSGRTVWTSDAGTNKKYSAADVSGAVFRHGGRSLLVHPTYRYLVCLDAETGKTLWEIPTEGSRNVTPVYGDGLLFWDGGMLELSPDGGACRQLWRRPGLASMAQAVMLERRLYVFGNPASETQPAVALAPGATPPGPAEPEGSLQPTENRGAAEQTKAGTPLDEETMRTPTLTGPALLCLDARTGALIHSIPAADPGHIIAADGMVYTQELIRNPDGGRKVPAQLRLTLIKPTAGGFEIAGRFIPTLAWEESHWEFYHYAEKSKSPGKLIGFTDEDFGFQKHVNPVIANGRLYVRFGPLMCFDLRGPGTPH